MKPFYLLAFSLFLFQWSFAQESGTFTKSLFELRYSVDMEKFEDFLEQYKNAPIKSKIIRREMVIAMDGALDVYSIGNGENIDTEEKYILGIQNAIVYSRDRNYLGANKILDTLAQHLSEMTLFQRAEFNRIKGRVFMNWGSYYQSLTYLTKAEQQFKEAGSVSGLLVSHYSILILFIQFHRWDLFEQKLNAIVNKKWEKIKKYPPILANFNTSRASLLFINENIDSALVLIKNNIPIYQQLLDSSNVMKTHLNLGFSYARMNRMNEAFHHFEKSRAYKTMLADKRQEIRSLISMTSILASQKHQARTLQLLEFDKVEDFFASIEERLKNVNDQDLHLHFLRQKVLYYEARKEQAKTLAAINQENDFLYDVITSDTTSLQLLQYQLDLQIAENKQLALQQENTENQNQILSLQLGKQQRQKMIYLGIFLASLLFLGGFWHYSNSVNKERHAKEIYALQVAETEKKLSETERALLAFKKQTIEKTKIIATITEGLELKDEEKIKHNEKLKQMKILTTEDWLKFQKLFNSVYPKMTSSLIENKIELSEGERRILMLYKMNFHKVQMSEVLGISPESVRKAIYRLKKKIEPQELDFLLSQF